MASAAFVTTGVVPQCTQGATELQSAEVCSAVAKTVGSSKSEIFPTWLPERRTGLGTQRRRGRFLLRAHERSQSPTRRSIRWDEIRVSPSPALIVSMSSSWAAEVPPQPPTPVVRVYASSAGWSENGKSHANAYPHQSPQPQQRRYVGWDQNVIAPQLPSPPLNGGHESSTPPPPPSNGTSSSKNGVISLASNPSSSRRTIDWDTVKLSAGSQVVSSIGNGVGPGSPSRRAVDWDIASYPSPRKAASPWRPSVDWDLSAPSTGALSNSTKPASPPRRTVDWDTVTLAGSLPAAPTSPNAPSSSRRTIDWDTVTISSPPHTGMPAATSPSRRTVGWDAGPAAPKTSPIPFTVSQRASPSRRTVDWDTVTLSSQSAAPPPGKSTSPARRTVDWDIPSASTTPPRPSTTRRVTFDWETGTRSSAPPPAAPTSSSPSRRTVDWHVQPATTVAPSEQPSSPRRQTLDWDTVSLWSNSASPRPADAKPTVSPSRRTVDWDVTASTVLPVSPKPPSPPRQTIDWDIATVPSQSAAPPTPPSQPNPTPPQRQTIDWDTVTLASQSSAPSNGRDPHGASSPSRRTVNSDVSSATTPPKSASPRRQTLDWDTVTLSSQSSSLQPAPRPKSPSHRAVDWDSPASPSANGSNPRTTPVTWDVAATTTTPQEPARDTDVLNTTAFSTGTDMTNDSMSPLPPTRLTPSRRTVSLGLDEEHTVPLRPLPQRRTIDWEGRAAAAAVRPTPPSSIRTVDYTVDKAALAELQQRTTGSPVEPSSPSQTVPSATEPPAASLSTPVSALVVGASSTVSPPHGVPEPLVEGGEEDETEEVVQTAVASKSKVSPATDRVVDMMVTIVGAMFVLLFLTILMPHA